MKKTNSPGPAIVVPIVVLLLLLVFPSLSVKGAQDGLDLWFQVVLPTLMPFMVCTQAIMACGGSALITAPFYHVIHAAFGLSRHGTYVLLCGLLCGYPLGAAMCASSLREGRISQREAEYLLSFCNHPSPMFLLGYVQGQLPYRHPLLLLLCLYLPILPVSMIAGRWYHFPSASSDKVHTDPPASSYSAPVKRSPDSAPVKRSLDEILMNACETMVMVGSYIMLFSILSAWVRHIPGIPAVWKSLLTGIAEITTGVHQVCRTFSPDRVMLPCVAVTAFGGLSGIFQTGGVIKNAGLSIRHYLGWKALHALLSVLCCLLLQRSLLIL